MNQIKIEKDYYNSIWKVLGQVFLSWFATAYFYITADSVLGLDLPLFLPLAIGMLFLGLYSLLSQWKSIPGVLLRVALILLPAAGFFVDVIKIQWVQVIYDAGETLSDYGISFGRGIPASSMSDDRIFCSVCICFWISVVIFILSRKNAGFLYFLGVLGTLYVMIRFGVSLSLLSVCMLLCWGAAVWSSHFFCGAGLCVIYIVAVFFAVIIFGVQGNTAGQITQAGSTLMSSLQEKRFGSENSSLKNGNLLKDTAAVDENKAALEVTMEYPQSMYLRGYVGNVFQNDSWKEAVSFLKSRQAGILNNSENLLDELAAEGYYSQNQMEHVALIDEEISDASQTVSVKNVGADRRYLYTPYEAGADFQDLTDGKTGVLNQAEMLLSTGFFGQTDYKYQVISPFSAWKRIWLSHRSSFRITQETGQESSNDKILYEEEYYKEYVYRCFLNLSQDTKDLIANAEGIDERYSGNITPISAVEAVRSWLDHYMKYDKTSGYDAAKYSGIDRYLFSGEAVGGDDYYATAAVLLFRYLGIPSRYVEGYVVTNEAADRSDEGRIKLHESDAHAWAEIYVDELGWIPVEVLSEYIEGMNSYLPDSGTSGSMIDSSKSDDTKTGEEKQDEQTGEKKKESEETTGESENDTDVSQGSQKETGRIPLLLLIPAVILILGVILFACLLGYWNHLKTKKRRYERKWRHTVNDKKCVLMWYRNLECVSSILIDSPLKMEGKLTDNRIRNLFRVICTLDKNCDREGLSEMLKIRQRAVYSHSEITREERRFAEQIGEKEVKALEEKLGFREKIIYTYVAGRLSLVIDYLSKPENT